MLQWYSVRLQIYSWFMKYCHPKLVSAGVIASDVGRRQQQAGAALPPAAMDGSTGPTSAAMDPEPLR